MTKRMIITGALSYSGRYIAALAHERGWKLHSLEGARSFQRANEYDLPITLFDWEDPQKAGRVEEAMQACDVFVNTYWRRPTAGDDATKIAEQHCYELFSAAKKAGVKRIVHISVAHADAQSELPYFRHKGRVEAYLKELGIPCTVLRPAMLFGDSAEESILMNNWSWCLRHSPVAGLIGDGSALIHPLHVRDLAEMVVTEAAREDSEAWSAYAAVGKECLSLRETTECLIEAMDLHHRLILPMPRWVAATSARFLARLAGGVQLFESEEIESLLAGYLAYPKGSLPQSERWIEAPPIHRFTEWLHQEGNALGRGLI